MRVAYGKAVNGRYDIGRDLNFSSNFRMLESGDVNAFDLIDFVEGCKCPCMPTPHVDYAYFSKNTSAASK